MVRVILLLFSFINDVLFISAPFFYLTTVFADPRKTPVVSVINYPPPDYTPHKTFRTSKLPDVTGTELPYKPSKGPLRNPLPPIEGTVPRAQTPAYNSLSPTSPPPPYEI